MALAGFPTLLGVTLRHRPRSLEERLFFAMAPRVHHALGTLVSGVAPDFDLWVVVGTALLPRSQLGNEGPGLVSQGM